MQVTVTEAMRIKNEISSTVSKVQAMQHQIQFVRVKEDVKSAENTENISGTISWPVFISKITSLFTMSEKINSILANYSIDSSISDKVREKANLQYLVDLFEVAIKNSESKTTTTSQVVGNNRVKIVTVYEPLLNKTELKDKIKVMKREVREIQSFIDSANSKMIELPFSYEDIENASID